MSDPRLRESTFSQYCLDSFRRRGSNIAFTQGNHHLTGSECHELTLAIAAVLEDNGVTRGDGVCLLSGNRPEAFLAQVAVQLIGARYTGLHPMGSFADHAFVIENSEARVLIYDPTAYSDRAAALEAAAGGVTVFSLGPGPVGNDILALAKSAAPPVSRAMENDIAFVFYTGGTSGKPKGVIHTQRSWYHQSLLVQSYWQWPSDPVLLVAAPISHAAGAMVAPALALGGRVVLVDGFTPGEFLRTIEAEQVSVTFLVPTMLYKLLDNPETRQRDLSSLQTLIYGAASITLERLAEARELFGEILMQGYGQTEIGNGALLLLKQDHRPDAPEILASAGRTPPGVEAIILLDDGTDAAPGEPGELCFRSASVMSGYWKLPELTSETLQGGWLHTGDIATRDAAGYITIVDRKKDMLISGGFNVYPKEVEEALNQHPLVTAAVVVGIPDPTWGEAVVALIQTVEGAHIDPDELKAWVREHKGPVYTPKHVAFVDDFPQTGLGKINKKAIRSEYSHISDAVADPRG